MPEMRQAAAPLIGVARRWLAQRRSARGVSTNSSHIIWAIIAVVAGVSALIATHNIWLPWLNGVYTSITGVTPSTTTLP